MLLLQHIHFVFKTFPVKAGLHSAFTFFKRTDRTVGKVTPVYLWVKVQSSGEPSCCYNRAAHTSTSFSAIIAMAIEPAS